MSVEIEEVRGFLAQFPPFSSLDEQALATVSRSMEIRYASRGDTLVTAGQPNDYVHVIRSGAVDVMDSEGVLLDRREAGRSCGYSTLVGENSSLYTMVCVEDSLILMWHRSHFAPIAQHYPEVARYYAGLSVRIKAAAQSLHQESHSDALRTQIGSFSIKNPAHIGPEVTVQRAAQTMEEMNVSSLLVVDGGTLDGDLLGIVTDRDLRRVVADSLSNEASVSEIMSTSLRTVTSDQLVFEALLILTELRIHHLPVVDGGKITGIVTAADIMRLMQANPLYLTGDLSRRESPEEMAEVYTQAHQMAVRFIERGANPAEVTGLLTVVADAMLRRLVELAQRSLGPAPIPWAFVVLGSQGRREMGLASDQDNALILDDSFDEEQHGAYFEQLAEYVCQGLATAGQALCPGDMMATNPQWRMTVGQWRTAFHGWITAPGGDALLYAQTFFDMRAVCGDVELAEAVHAQAMESAQGSPRLHAQLAALAARREPPVGIFRGLVVDRRGEYRNTLDVKKGGTAAIVQMARLFAIVGGQDVLGSVARIEAASALDHPPVSPRSAEDLQAALEFLNTLVLRHHAEQVRRGEQPDYHINPQHLSKLDREHLRDAFQIIKGLQNALCLKYPVRSM
ncbi:CBS domain-containing protein [Corynebacterium sp. zg254]|uniref:Cyclic nucleotide-binding/CBS domain-containing protein n=1 Tax=Corynebacterium zhongnanshanii TaxID=2768834 RepID=A0ABQ6VG75_9CORY|nr:MULTISPECIES: DUF294 nucleotidyltransferase-like domain-containing protein [Corynebacterium]KAB3523265.1 cyclic nucleotide-binding/CBS domain-containing protein [Corynebacterium zhongnanshanii]MCR5913617.1 CBS domain-containing protein [Corynebacterium sp. zg254]